MKPMEIKLFLVIQSKKLISYHLVAKVCKLFCVGRGVIKLTMEGVIKNKY